MVTKRGQQNEHTIRRIGLYSNLREILWHDIASTSSIFKDEASTTCTVCSISCVATRFIRLHACIPGGNVIERRPKRQIEARRSRTHITLTLIEYRQYVAFTCKVPMAMGHLPSILPLSEVLTTRPR